jgi:hypothetical protein
VTTKPNLDFVTDRIATGGDLPQVWEDAGAAVRVWQDLGITHVIDNRQEWTDEDVVARLAPEIGYLYNGVDDAGNGQPEHWFDDGVAWAREALRDPDAKVLIHCHMGINRGPSLAYAVLLDQGFDPVDAIAAIRTARPIAGVLYAEDALDWFHRRNGVDPARRSEDRRRLAQWRRENRIDVVRIIRDIREAEAADRVA